MMNNKELVLSVHYNMGREDAQTLRDKAVAGEVTDTEIIDSEHAVPDWNPKGDYSVDKVPLETPVRHGGQVYALIQNHNAANYANVEPGTEGGAPFWRIKHTTNPKKAKPWIKPTATSPYKVGECMLWTDGVVKRALRDTTFSPDEYAADWEDAA